MVLSFEENCTDRIIKEAAKRLVVMDGPMGTELERRGYDVNDRLWSARLLDRAPEAIRRIHWDYFAAGADIVTCASYQGSTRGFMEAGYSAEEAEGLIRRSMELVLEARKAWWEGLPMEDGAESLPAGKDSGRPYPLAAGDIGPYGAYLSDGSEYTGLYRLSGREYRDFHLPRIQILKDAGAELFAVETMPRLDEALACAEMLEELGAKYWVSFTFLSEHRTCGGNSLEELAKELNDLPGLIALGVNCSPPELVRGIVRRLKGLTEKDICVYPNSGETYDGINKSWSRGRAGSPFEAMARDWFMEGARYIGGCCRTRPEDIRAIASWTDADLNRMCRIDYR
jgi:homocysteine S-methyltransferase